MMLALMGNMYDVIWVQETAQALRCERGYLAQQGPMAGSGAATTSYRGSAVALQINSDGSILLHS